MRLKIVHIRGFRSIEKMDIPFDGNGHKILVGKNDSGKSNILDALNLLSGNITFKQKDKKELYNKDAFVTFRFDLEDDEIAKCKVKFAENFPAGLEIKLTDDHTAKTFFEEYSKYLLYVVRCGKDGYWGQWQLDENLQIQDGWYSVNPKVVEYGLNEKIPAGSFISEGYIEKHLHKNDQEAIRNCLSPASLEDVYNVLRQQVREIAAPKNYTFPMRYWRYDAQEHDLPSSISREAFSQNPDSCIPLKNMFLLANIKETEIHSRVSKANSQGPNQLISLLNYVNTKTNEYIKKSWKEYSNVKIELWPNGENVVIAIQDSENKFDFKQRSDGFRRLVSFLLLISTELDTGRHPHAPLILIDEPETGLHPSSAKDLKYKLIELGQKTSIIYATHSISMIDAENIESNLIVSKNKENTTFEKAKEDGTSPAEIIYQAIGHSIYEDLKKKNILLEGYTDKKTLRLFTKGKEWEDFGICFTDGGRNLETVISILELGSRKYFVLSDADEAAKQKKKEKGNPEYWYTYKDLGSEVISIEDFYENTFFTEIVQKVLKKYGIELEAPILSEENDRMESIKRFLHKERKDLLEERAKANNLKAADIVKQISGEIKIECANAVKAKNVIKDKVTEVLTALLQEINGGARH